jgi:hypothetical protein
MHRQKSSGGVGTMNSDRSAVGLTKTELDNWEAQTCLTGEYFDELYETRLTSKTLSMTDEDFPQLQNFWQELRLTQMSGRDYLFIPNFIYQAFGSSYSLAKFANELTAYFDLDFSRLQVICCCDSPDNQWLYGKIIVEWNLGAISHNHTEEIPINSKYHDFIELMFKHSSSLVVSAAH